MPDRPKPAKKPHLGGPVNITDVPPLPDDDGSDTDSDVAFVQPGQKEATKTGAAQSAAAEGVWEVSCQGPWGGDFGQRFHLLTTPFVTPPSHSPFSSLPVPQLELVITDPRIKGLLGAGGESGGNVAEELNRAQLLQQLSPSAQAKLSDASAVVIECVRRCCPYLPTTGMTVAGKRKYSAIIWRSGADEVRRGSGGWT